jgi:hypothetical protein
VFFYKGITIGSCRSFGAGTAFSPFCGYKTAPKLGVYCQDILLSLYTKHHLGSQEFMNNQTIKILNDLKLSIDEAARHCEIWWELGFSQNRKEFRKEFDSTEYNYFLHASYEAHSLTMFLSLGRIFDADSRSSSIRNLKSNLRTNGHRELTDIVTESLKPYSKTVQKILDIRSARIAHSDMNHTDESVLKSNSLSPDEVKELIYGVREAYYIVLRKLNLNTKQHPDGSFGESTLNLLRKLKN